MWIIAEQEIDKSVSDMSTFSYRLLYIHSFVLSFAKSHAR